MKTPLKAGTLHLSISDVLFYSAPPHSLELFPNERFLIHYFVGSFVLVFFFVFFNRMQSQGGSCFQAAVCRAGSIRGDGSPAPRLHMGCVASRGYPSFPMTSRTRRKTSVRSQCTYCLVPFPPLSPPPPRDRSGSGFGRAAGLFRFLSVTLGRTRLQFSSVRMISPNEKEKPFKTHFYH